MHLSLWLTVIVSGAAGGFLDSMAGMGFGALSSTIMISGGLPPTMVIGAVNLAKVGSGLASGLSHWRFGNVRWPWVLPMLGAAVTGGVLSSLVLTRLPEEAVRLAIPAVLMTMGVLILYRFLWRVPDFHPVAGGTGQGSLPTFETPTLTRPQVRIRESHLILVWLGSIGFIGGALNGLSGAFGPFTTSAIVLKQLGHPRFAIGTVNFVEFFVAGAVSATLILNAPPGQWHWGLPVALMAGSVATAPLGAYMSSRLPAKAVGVSVAGILITLNAWTLARAFL